MGGTLSHRELTAKLLQMDERFVHFKPQRFSDWRDPSVNDKIVWSEKTLEEIKQGFLPGRIQTHFNIFVSVFKLQSTTY